MAKVHIQSDRLRGTYQDFENIRKDLNGYRREMDSIWNHLRRKLVAEGDFDSVFRKVSEQIEQEREKVSMLGTAADSIAALYLAVEKDNTELLGGRNEAGTAGSGVPDPGSGAAGAVGVGLWSTLASIYHNGYIDSTDRKFSWSLLGGDKSRHVNASGTDVGNDAKFHIFHGTAEWTGEAEWSPAEGELKAEVGGKSKFHLADGKISGNLGFAKSTGEVSIGNESVSGAIGATIFSGGVFMPSVYAKAEAKANAAEGSLEGQFGTDEYNTHVKAEGSVLGAEAEAKFEAGKIVDEDGNERVGVAASVGAETYVAEGSVSGGFSIFGIKIDATIEGKLGGAGAKGGAEVTNSSAEGEIGFGFGLGAGFKIKVDWSGFKWPWS